MDTIDSVITNQVINKKPFPEALHESLLTHKIITDSRVKQCGEYYSTERGFFKQRIQCGNIKQCPICRTRVAPNRIQEFIDEQEVCLYQNGSLYMLTGTLRHRKSDSLKYLQNKLSTSVKRLKNQGRWREIQASKIIPTRTVFETVYGKENGFHPHVMMIYGSNNPEINQTKIRDALNPYWFKYTGANLDVTKLDGVSSYPFKDWDYDLKSIFQKMNEDMRKRFDKPTLETMLVAYDHLPQVTPSLPLPTVTKVLKSIYKNLSYYLGR